MEYNEELLSIREAVEKDCPLVFEWARDEKAKQIFVDQKIMDFELYKMWYLEKIHNRNSLLYIMNFGEYPVGYMRLERAKGNAWLLHFIISKECRGKGLGSEMLKLAKEKHKEELLIGQVEPDNIGSCSAFQKAGFFLVDDSRDYIFYSKPVADHNNKKGLQV